MIRCSGCRKKATARPASVAKAGPAPWCPGGELYFSENAPQGKSFIHSGGLTTQRCESAILRYTLKAKTK
eukprot:6456169-Amphidinium_carterae.2